MWILLDFWVGSFSLGARFLQIFGQIARESAEAVRFDGNFLAEGLDGVSVICAV